MSELSYAERLARVKAPPPKTGMRIAPHIVERERKKAAAKGVKPQLDPNRYAKAMHAATFNDETGMDVLGWNSLSKEELKEQARQEALARQAREKQRRDELAAKEAEKKRLKAEKEARRREEVAKQKAAKKRRQEAERRRKEAERVPPPESLFPATKRSKRAAKRARKKAREQELQRKREGPTKRERREAREAEEKARVEAAAKAGVKQRGNCSGCGWLLFTVFLLIAGFVGAFWFAAHHHKAIVPQAMRDHLQKYIQSTVHYIEDMVEPATSHVAAMNARLAADEQERLRQQQRARLQRQQNGHAHDGGEL